MTSIVKLEALSGVKDDGPLCYLLQIDESYVLLDCGWDDTFDLGYIEAVKERVPQINAVLLTFPDIAHLGALPYLVTKCGLNCPVYATVPVFKMGQMFMYDWVNSHLAVEDFDVFSLDDVDAAFERVQQVKYNQTILMKGDNGIQFTPLAAGHMIGGAIWKISKQGDEEIIYAVDFNHKKERHLNGALFDSISRPHLLITDAFNATYTQSKRRDRDEELVTKMLATVKGGGDCLVVIDTAGRILEIAHLLDGLWSNIDAGLGNYNLVMLSHVASTVVDFAKSQVEWMSEKILKSFENGRYNPFAFRNVQLCHSLTELTRVRSPKVVLCSGTDMECGFSRELFLECSSDSRNCIILTCRAGTRTLGSKLISMADPGRNASRQVQIEVKRRIRLEGMELDQYRRKKFEKDQEAARQRLEQSRRNARIGLSQDEDDDDSEDEEALANAVAAVTGIKPAGMVPATPVSVANAGRRQSQQVPPTPSTASQQSSAAVQAASQLALDNPYDLMLKFEYHQKSAFFKQTKKTYPMFPYIEEKVKWDDYGEIIRPEEYITNESIVPEANPSHDGDDMKMEADGVKKEMKSSQPVEEWPTKCISYHQKLEVLCKLEYIDFEGRSDGESIKKILAQIKPKQLIIVHGSKEATHHLAQYARDNGIVQGKIFTPSLGLVIDATVESHIYQVMLSDAVMTQMMFQPVKEAELSWIDARIVHREPEDEEMDAQDDAEMMEVDEEGNPLESQEPKRLKQKKRQNVFHLEALAQTSIPSHQAVFVNDPKLSDLKQILVSAGYQAEFSSGVLFINGIASIKRNEAGKFHVEGCAGVDYYRIRDVIYNQFAII